MKLDKYAGIGFIILTFTNLYYQHFLYGIVSGVAYVFLVWSLVYLKRDKKEVVKGVVFGIITAAISYYIVDSYFVTLA